jgi:predicted O-methyltransferase YrrM
METIESQLSSSEKAILRQAVEKFASPRILEIGTYKGGGSTLTFLEALKSKDCGRLIGVEASAEVFAEMKANIESVDADYSRFFEAIEGFSQQVIPKILTGISTLDIVFLDGGNNPREQIEEFELIKNSIPVGGYLFSHDANLRKGQWFVPYILALDNWRTTVHQVSEEGLLEAIKLADSPSAQSLAKAAQRLQRCMLSPVEFAARFFPSPFKGAVLSLMPYKLRRRLGEGRR